MTATLFQQVAERTTGPWWGIVVPALIFVIAFVVTLLLYRHFTDGHGKD